jgi:hypothetical protein
MQGERNEVQHVKREVSDEVESAIKQLAGVWLGSPGHCLLLQGCAAAGIMHLTLNL